jgi:prepilin-type N-terminal cleavage/methylation domain-containing protein
MNGSRFVRGRQSLLSIDRGSSAFSLIELVVGLAVIAIISVIGLNFIPIALEQHRASKVTAAQASLRNLASQYMYDRANQADYIFEAPSSSSTYVFSYDSEAQAGPTLTARAIDPRFPTMLVVMEGGRRGKKVCTPANRGSDASLHKQCDDWNGYL